MQQPHLLARGRRLAPTCAMLLGLAGPLAAQRASPYEVVPVERGAALTGRATFAGTVPAPRSLMITRDLEICGEGFRERHDVTVSDGGGLQNVVVFIAGITAGKPWPEVPDGYMLDQKDCTFMPHVQVIRRGADVRIINSDPVLHNIHGYELIGGARRTLFNLGQPPEKQEITQALRPRRGRQVRLECDSHDFMLGWAFAADTPYAVVVNADGTFAIDAIPAGTYTVTAWHPHLGTREQTVTVTADGRAEVAFHFGEP